MSCDAFLERVQALLDGGLGGSDRQEMLRHLEVCADCRGFVAALAAAEDAQEEPGLAEAILARTSGAACAGARSRLCARIDLGLDPFDADLVDGHLQRCAECASLARALERIEQDLPFLAAVDPGPHFVEEVLARTSRHPRRASRGARGAVAIFARLLDRPRVAWEGALAATLLLFAPVLAPGSPLASLPHRAVGQLRGTVNEIEATLVVGARDARATIGAVVVDDSIALATDGWEAIRERFGTFPGSAASVQASGGTDTSNSEPDAAQEKKP